MDRESESEREVNRIPTDADLVSLARELNRLGVAYVSGKRLCHQSPGSCSRN